MRACTRVDTPSSPRDIDPVAMLKTIPEERVTHAFLVPAVLQFMPWLPGVATTDYSALTVIVYGASPISRGGAVESTERFGCRVLCRRTA